jgi:plastocyanin
VVEMSRRAFISTASTAVAGAALGAFAVACGGASTDVTEPGPVVGAVRGTVVDLEGHAQGVGRIYLLQKTGLNVGVFVDVDASGQFDFGPVPVGAYLLRYWGANRADVPEDFHNPVRISVDATIPTIVEFRILVAENSSTAERDIYAGDYFFQEQPTGVPNAPVVVNKGTLVCWYNVGSVLHNVSGGPWGESGAIALDGNFMWQADVAGTFLYSCSYH